MQTRLRWKKNFLSNLYSIYSNDHQIGELREKTFSQTAHGHLNGKSYTFKTSGFFKQYTQIIDSTENRVIGKISYNSWMTKAFISIDNKIINWKYDNLWNTKWSVFDSEGLNINYAGSSASGQIDSNSADALLLLCGLFVTNYFWQMSVAVIIAILVPIWTITLG